MCPATHTDADQPSGSSADFLWFDEGVLKGVGLVLGKHWIQAFLASPPLPVCRNACDFLASLLFNQFLRQCQL